MLRKITTFVLLAVPAAVLGCATPAPEAQDETPPPPPRLTTEPWTEAFEAPAVLVAERIVIRGPDRIAERFVAVQDPGNVDFEAETTSEGLRQTFRVRSPGASARGQLDQWALAAYGTLIVLQQPGEVDVRIEAQGDVFFQPAEAPTGERAPTMSFRGEVDWPDGGR